MAYALLRLFQGRPLVEKATAEQWNWGLAIVTFASVLTWSLVRYHPSLPDFSGNQLSSWLFLIGGIFGSLLVIAAITSLYKSIRIWLSAVITAVFLAGSLYGFFFGHPL